MIVVSWLSHIYAINSYVVKSVSTKESVPFYDDEGSFPIRGQISQSLKFLKFNFNPQNCPNSFQLDLKLPQTLKETKHLVTHIQCAHIKYEAGNEAIKIMIMNT